MGVKAEHIKSCSVRFRCTLEMQQPWSLTPSQSTQLNMPSPNSHLIPVPSFQYGFTSNPLIKMYSEGEGISPRLAYVNLTDKALGAHKVSSRTSHELVSPPSPDTKSSAIDSEAISEDVSSTAHSTSTWKSALSHPTCLSITLSLPPPSTAWEALYPKGSINPSAEIPGGFGFYLAGTKDFSDLLEGPGQGQPSATEVVMSYRMMLERDWEWAKGGKLPGICKCNSYS